MVKRSGGSPRTVLEQRAEDIVANNPILYLKNNRYKVESQSEPGKYYDVNYLDDWSCTCTYHAKRHTYCKHIIAAQMIVMKVEPLEPTDFTIRKPVPKRPKERCGSTNCKFYELRPRKNGGASERYRCTECDCRFTHRPGFLGRHYDDVAISGTLDDVVEGYRLRSTSNEVGSKIFSCGNCNRDRLLYKDRANPIRFNNDGTNT